jgi:hypothetical protein
MTRLPNLNDTHISPRSDPVSVLIVDASAVVRQALAVITIRSRALFCETPSASQSCQWLGHSRGVNGCIQKDIGRDIRVNVSIVPSTGILGFLTGAHPRHAAR